MRILRFLPLVLLLVTVVLARGASAIVIGPGVVCQTDVGMQYRFENTMHFSNVSLGDDHLKLDALDLRFAFGGTFYVNITRINYVDRSLATVFIVEWNGTANRTTTSWFNVSGLTPGVEYTFLVDGATVAAHSADSFGAITLNYTNANTLPHRFDITTAYAAIAGVDWLMFLLIFLMVFLVTLGLLDAFDFGGIWLIFAGLVGLFLAVQAYTVTSSLAISIISAGFGCLLVIAGVFKEL